MPFSEDIKIKALVSCGRNVVFVTNSVEIIWRYII